MKYSLILCLSITILTFSAVATATSPFDFSQLTLIDTVDCATDTTHDFAEFSNGVSRVETILGENVRTLPNDSGTMKYFAYRLGAGGVLEADKGYVLRILYPQDEPRTLFIRNRGCETTRGFHTSRTTGDGMKVPYVSSNSESLELPLTDRMESWDMLFYLHERFPDLADDTRTQTPSNGFWVLCLQLSPENDPLSRGVAVQRIELYEAPALDAMTQPLAVLPPGLPKRHLFWREEMADGVISGTDPLTRGLADDMTWYEHKFRLMRFLGMQTFAKDLLEFGANQGWDSSKYGGNSWVYQSKHRARWSQIVQRCGELGFDVLPYYEYAGSKGVNGLGFERRCRPLYGNGVYTHINWSESANADITDPDTFEDFRKMLEITVLDECHKTDFAGIWMRTRVTDLPIGFADATRARFAAEAGYATNDVTRALISSDSNLYNEYIDWWYGKRRIFLEQVRDYLRTNVNAGIDVLFTADSSESGKGRINGATDWNLVAEDPSAWSAQTNLLIQPLATALQENMQLTRLTNDWYTYYWYEWQHSVPHADPIRYKDTGGIYMTETVNRAYTLEPNVMNAFHAKDGLAAIRHYCLNEDATKVGTNRYEVGYFVSDVDYAGPFVMHPEALAFAHGDPNYFGYLASSTFNRGNPYYVRRFNANFLALPALPSVIDATLCAHSNIVARRIETAANGTYIGLVNIGYHAVSNAQLQLPEPGHLINAVTGETLGEEIPSYSLSLDPCELRAFRFFTAASNSPPEIAVDDELTLEWFNALTTHTGWRVLEFSPTVTDHDSGDRIDSILWSVASGGAGQVQFSDPTSLNTRVAFKHPGTYVLNLAVSDGTATRNQPITVTVETSRAQIPLSPDMADYTDSGILDSGLFDNQNAVTDPPSGDLGCHWVFDYSSTYTYPKSFTVDLQQEYPISEICLLDYNGVDTFRVYAGSKADGWTNVVECLTDTYQTWRRYYVDISTRHLKIEIDGGQAMVGELVLFGPGGGLDTTDALNGRANLRLAIENGNQAALHYEPNALKNYRLESSTDLSTWVPVQIWNGTDPFPVCNRPMTNQAAYYRLLELP